MKTNISMARLRYVFIAVIATVVLILLWEGYLYLKNRIIISVDNKRISVFSRHRTVENVLKEQNIALGEKDIVVPPLYSAAPNGGMIRITRVLEKTEQFTEIPPFKILWKKKLTDHLRPVELQKGIQKRIKKETVTIYYDGALKEKRTTKERYTKSTIYRLALLNKDDSIEEIYDLSKCKKLKMTATAYFPGDRLAWRDGTETYLGLKMQRGIVAVDPKIIPLRTRVYIPGYGYGYAGDTGSAIKNMRIDLGVNNAEEDKEWIYKPVTVYLLEKSRTW